VSSTVFYESGSEYATLTNSFYVASVLTDPTTVSLIVTTPAGVATTYTYAGATITKTSTGIYTKDVACSEDGLWSYEWVGTGTAADVVAGQWQVFQKPADAGLYCTVEALKSRLGITNTADDHELTRAVRAASRLVDSYCGRRPRAFSRDTAVTTRTFPASSSREVFITEGISTATGLIVKTDEAATGAFGTTLTVDTDFLLRPSNALADGWPYTEIWLADNYAFPILSSGRHGVQVTARFGWPTIPDDVSEAALIVAHRLFKRKETGTGVVGFDGQGITVRLSSSDPDAAALLAPYRLIGIA
jgi:hypothetical protein